MNLVEILVASVILVISSSCSLQLWASSTSSAEQSERRRHQLGQLEIALLGSQARLVALAAEPVASDCADAARWLVVHLQSQPLEAGLSREVSTAPGALVRVRISSPGVGERQRWLSPAAYGMCRTKEQQVDGTR